MAMRSFGSIVSEASSSSGRWPNATEMWSRVTSGTAVLNVSAPEQKCDACRPRRDHQGNQRDLARDLRHGIEGDAGRLLEIEGIVGAQHLAAEDGGPPPAIRGHRAHA